MRKPYKKFAAFDAETLQTDPKEFPQIAPETKFRFSCQLCGECCFRQLILLEPQDLFCLSRYANFSQMTNTTALFQKHWVKKIRLQNRFRCQLVMPRWQDTYKCRFLSPVFDQKTQSIFTHWQCDLHAKGAKPFVCSLSPVAIAHEETASKTASFHLVAPTPDCPGMGKGKEISLQFFLQHRQSQTQHSLSRLFYRSIDARIAQNESLFDRIYDFDQYATINSLEELSQFMQKTILPVKP